MITEMGSVSLAHTEMCIYYLGIITRGQNKVGSWAYLALKVRALVRAHKILRQRTKMALENAGSYIKKYYKKTHLAMKKRIT